ncbi:MAG: hypothetical protein EOQ57_33255 [Mesorhizobium sp.]|nr:MAG: hypothetical protein EOQ57_33255 [Mesorhizobium sp.]TGV18147.1 hypothetical protein EN786_34825 [Mesorhizobium sp. M4B.F.Ca.ET.143.01.1.1]
MRWNPSGRACSRKRRMPWRIVSDDLDTHRSEGVVRLVARQCAIDEATVGRKRARRSPCKEGQPRGGPQRSEPSHHLPLCPQARLWLNQIEIWFSILVRKLLRRASFTSTADLKDRIERFIDSFSKTWQSHSNGLGPANP